MSYDALLVDFQRAGGSGGNDITLGVREAKDVAIAFTALWREMTRHSGEI